jgi:predicted RNA binding protein YcfA (HicA-like mRNA interferase family)
MAKLPVLSDQEIVRALERAGWRQDRQRGSHIVLLKEGSTVSLSVPQHREVAPGTLRALIRKPG